jgi:hypothetical protein
VGKYGPRTKLLISKMSEGLDSGLFGISLSDSEDSTCSPEAGAQSNGASTETAKKTGTARVAQTEESYQNVKDTYRVKVENGEVSWQSILSWTSSWQPLEKTPLC